MILSPVPTKAAECHVSKPGSSALPSATALCQQELSMALGEEHKGKRKEKNPTENQLQCRVAAIFRTA